MIPISLADALVREKTRNGCCGGAPCCADWCRLECPKR